MKDKFILDACCGPRMMWFNKQHPNCLYIDIRDEDKGFMESRDKREIKPDMVADFRDMPFKDKSFKLVVWDPPHIIQKYNPKVRMLATYGSLNPETWQSDLKKGFKECWRVLEDNGILIFKWSNCNKWSNSKAKGADVIKFFPVMPLFGQKAGKTATWYTYMKMSDNMC